MSESIGRLLEQALELVKRDAPFCTQAMATALGTTRVEVSIGGEPFVIFGDGHEVMTRSGRGPASTASDEQTTVSTTPTTLLELIEGTCDLVTLITANTLRVSAAPARAAELFDALRIFVEGCARSPDTLPILETFRAQVRARTERSTP